jgi:type IV secretion system protein VirB6
MLITSNGENDEGGNFSLSTIKFLKSNIHPLSNITSCIKDVISWVLIGPPDVDTTRLPFFSLLQSKLKGIILATLTLYIAMLGIHIMLHYNEMSTGKMIMFALKFALVYYFTLGDIWSTLFPTIINISNELMSIFSLSELSNDVARYCSYSYQGQEILSERTLPAIGSVSTLGQGGSIRLTFWDYLDCKLINYINLGTCVYEPFTMFATIIGCLISNIILFIVMYLYLVMTFQLVVSMIEVSILSLFTICILILISPIFILFALFNATKDIFDQWLKAFLGYLLYPPLITIFFVLIIFSLDALYYGDIKSKTPFRDQSGAPLYATSLGPVEDESLTPCYGVDSPFCVTAKFYEGGYVKDGAKYSMNLCKLDDLSQIWERSYYTNKPIFSAGPLGKAKKAFTEHFFSAFGKMCIWSFIFWHFFAILVDLSAQILGILPFTSITDKKGLLLNQKKGKGDILNATWKAGAWVASLPFKRSKS